MNADFIDKTSQDESSYGKKLLFKMGWSEGKGLGKDEDGIQDYIKVKMKGNRKGVGYQGNDDKWVTHQVEFETLLSDLNGGKQETSELKGVENRSRKLRGRIHYSKFLKSKDLSQKKESDMNAIFLMNRVQAEEVEKTALDGGTNTWTSNMNAEEYFTLKRKEKMEQDKAKNSKISKSTIENGNSTDENSTMATTSVGESPHMREKKKKSKVNKSVAESNNELGTGCQQTNEDSENFTESNQLAALTGSKKRMCDICNENLIPDCYEIGVKKFKKKKCVEEYSFKENDIISNSNETQLLENESSTKSPTSSEATELSQFKEPDDAQNQHVESSHAFYNADGEHILNELSKNVKLSSTNLLSIKGYGTSTKR